eukprot:COSAG01_NODE_44315_length_420_cov_1.037383_1_plen_61_part_10
MFASIAALSKQTFLLVSDRAVSKWTMDRRKNGGRRARALEWVTGMYAADRRSIRAPAQWIY